MFLYVLGITKFAVPNTDKHPLLQMHCDDDLQDWLTESWSLMIPLLCSLGCAILIEIILVSRVDIAKVLSLILFMVKKTR